MHLIELEIIRYKLYNDIVIQLTHKLKTYLKIKEIKHLLLRYILNRNIFTANNNNIGDPLFIILKNDNKIADKQLEADFEYFKINNTSLYHDVNTLIINSIQKASDFIKKLNIKKISTDNRFNIFEKNNIQYLQYESNTLNNIYDNYIVIKNNKIMIPYYSHIDFKQYEIAYVFCTLFRYKYIFIDTHSSSLNYSNADKNLSIECFSTPFNRYHNLYCSAFHDLEIPLGSLGNFFSIYKFPSKNLLVNPPFDNTIMYYAIKHTLDIMKKEKYNVIFTLPDWTDAEYYNLLYNSPYFIKAIRYKKNELEFTNFFEGMTYSPCANIQIYLSNL
jgi:hypothetical protein